MAVEDMELGGHSGQTPGDIQDRPGKDSQPVARLQEHSVNHQRVAENGVFQNALRPHAVEIIDVDAIKSDRHLPPSTLLKPVVPTAITGNKIQPPKVYGSSVALSTIPSQSVAATAANSNHISISNGNGPASGAQTGVPPIGPKVQSPINSNQQGSTQTIDTPVSVATSSSQRLAAPHAAPRPSPSSIPNPKLVAPPPSLPRVQHSIFPIARYASSPPNPSTSPAFVGVPTSESRGTSPAQTAAVQRVPDTKFQTGSSSGPTSSVPIDHLSEKRKLESSQVAASDPSVIGTKAHATIASNQDEDDVPLNKLKKAKVAKPREAQPREAQPREAQPREAQPREAQPREAQPREAQPREAQPREAQPREAQPREAQPREAQPREAQPREAQPREAQPREAQPREAQPREAQPREAQPQTNNLAAIVGNAGISSASHMTVYQASLGNDRAELPSQQPTSKQPVDSTKSSGALIVAPQQVSLIGYRASQPLQQPLPQRPNMSNVSQGVPLPKSHSSQLQPRNDLAPLLHTSRNASSPLVTKSEALADSRKLIPAGSTQSKQLNENSGSIPNHVHPRKQPVVSKQVTSKAGPSIAPPLINKVKKAKPQQQAIAPKALPDTRNEPKLIPKSGAEPSGPKPSKTVPEKKVLPASDVAGATKPSPLPGYIALVERLNSALLRFYGMNVTQNSVGQRLELDMSDSQIIRCVLEQALAVFVPDHRSLIDESNAKNWQLPSEIEQNRKKDLMDKVIDALIPNIQLAQAVDQAAFDELLRMPELINSLALWMLAFIQRRDFRAAKSIAKFLWNLPLRSLDDVKKRRLSIRAVKKAKVDLDPMKGEYQTSALVTSLFEKWRDDYDNVMKTEKSSESSAGGDVAEKKTIDKVTGKKSGRVKPPPPTKKQGSDSPEKKVAAPFPASSTLQKAAAEASRKRQLDAISDGAMFSGQKKKAAPTLSVPRTRPGLSSTLNKTLYDWKVKTSSSEISKSSDALGRKRSDDSDATTTGKDASVLQEETYSAKPSSKGKNVRWAPDASLRQVRYIESKEERKEEFLPDFDEAEGDNAPKRGDEEEDEDEGAQGSHSGLSRACIDEVVAGHSPNTVSISQKKHRDRKPNPTADMMWIQPRILLVPKEARAGASFNGSRTLVPSFEHRHQPATEIPTFRVHDADSSPPSPIENTAAMAALENVSSGWASSHSDDHTSAAVSVDRSFSTVDRNGQGSTLDYTPASAASTTQPASPSAGDASRGKRSLFFSLSSAYRSSLMSSVSPLGVDRDATSVVAADEFGGASRDRGQATTADASQKTIIPASTNECPCSPVYSPFPGSPSSDEAPLSGSGAPIVSSFEGSPAFASDLPSAEAASFSSHASTEKVVGDRPPSVELVWDLPHHVKIA